MRNQNYIFIGNLEISNKKANDFLKNIYENKNLENLSYYIQKFDLAENEIYKKKDFDLLWDYLSVESFEIPRCIFIYKFDRISEIIGSLFLKIMEKNIDNLYFFLFVNNENLILKTILSRCIKYNFLENNIKFNKILEIIFDKNLTANQFDELLEKINISEIETIELKETLLNKIIEKGYFKILDEIKNLFENQIYSGMQNYFWRIIFIKIKNNI